MAGHNTHENNSWLQEGGQSLEKINQFVARSESDNDLTGLGRWVSIFI